MHNGCWIDRRSDKSFRKKGLRFFRGMNYALNELYKEGKFQNYDAFFLINNLNEFGKFKVGEQLFFKLPVSDKNDYGYRYGKDFGLNLWVSYRFFQYLSGSLKINYQYKVEMEGFDNEMNKRMSPAMDSKNQGFNKLNLGLGFNFVNNSIYFKNNRLALELLIPIYRDYEGIQMADSFSFILGWQY